MAEEILLQDLKKDIVAAKNHDERRFNFLTQNFYVLSSAIRYFAVKREQSVTSKRVAENFPVSIPAAGSGLKVLEELEVIEPRNSSGSSSRYMPSKIDMDKLEEVRKILIENYEIGEFTGKKKK